MLRIALIHDSILPAKNYGGIERVVLSLAREYTKLGHQVVIVCREGSPLKDFETKLLPRDFSMHDVQKLLPPQTFQHWHQPIPQAPNAPYLVTIHGNGQPGEAYLPNTNFLSESHARDHGGKYFVYNGVDVSEFPFVKEKDDYFVFLARAKWRVKNLKTAIALARDLNVRLEVIGGEGISTRLVRYHGSLGESQGKLKIVSKAKALLYPTNWQEPFGLALLEAWSCGTPVISSVNGAMDELVVPGVGFKCRSYDEFLAAGKKIKTIDPVACRKHVELKYTSTRMAQKYVQLIEQILNEGILKQKPHYAFDKTRTQLLYKPTFLNRMKLQLTGKI
jgi:glycosyltransferase involved in cell wall biosynthesis